MQLALNDVELPPASPYTGKFVGYNISKGKLGLSLDYKVANRKLDAKNNLVLDQFTFGDKVASPVATHAPVRLAVALLKDRHGVIDIDLPISGSLDDPHFKVWPAVLKVLGNLVVKAATAPFSVIAAAFGGGDQLSRVDFAAGGATLDDDAQRKLRSLGKALEERPGLSLEIEGAADPNRDRDGLRRFLVERKLKAQKVAELVQQGTAVASPDQVRIDASERPRLIAAAYDGEKFAKPKNALGLEKTLPPNEMEQLLFQNTQVTDEDLRALALRRATVLEAGLAKNAPSATGSAVPGGAAGRHGRRPRRAEAEEGLTTFSAFDAGVIPTPWTSSRWCWACWRRWSRTAFAARLLPVKIPLPLLQIAVGAGLHYGGFDGRVRLAPVPAAVHPAAAVPGRLAHSERRVLPRLEGDPGAGDRAGRVHGPGRRPVRARADPRDAAGGRLRAGGDPVADRSGRRQGDDRPRAAAAAPHAHPRGGGPAERRHGPGLLHIRGAGRGHRAVLAAQRGAAVRARRRGRRAGRRRRGRGHRLVEPPAGAARPARIRPPRS